jgi:hypothetical protein
MMQPADQQRTFHLPPHLLTGAPRFSGFLQGKEPGPPTRDLLPTVFYHSLINTFNRMSISQP